MDIIEVIAELLGSIIELILSGSDSNRDNKDNKDNKNN